jgi:hypothetical protein
MNARNILALAVLSIVCGGSMADMTPDDVRKKPAADVEKRRHSREKAGLPNR